MTMIKRIADYFKRKAEQRKVEHDRKVKAHIEETIKRTAVLFGQVAEQRERLRQMGEEYQRKVNLLHSLQTKHHR